METRIRRAGPDEAQILTELAHDSKRYWGYPERWMTRWREALTLTPKLIEENAVYVATHGETLVGFYALSCDCDDWSMEHLWLRPAWAGRGIGRSLFEHAVKTARLRGARNVTIESDPHAEGFYLRMGARRAGEVAADVDGARRRLPKLVFELRDA